MDGDGLCVKQVEEVQELLSGVFLSQFLVRFVLR